jgi:transcriptional regulator GlxA family with amidase domain
MDRERVGIVLFDDVEVLDYCGPFEVFSVTRLDEARRRQEPSPFEVLLVADFAHCPPLDLLLVPGGLGTRREMASEAMLGFVRDRAARAGLVASVCTGALILGRAGLLSGLRATTHWRSLDLLQELCPDVRVDRASQVVDEGRIMTSAGIAAGIDLALLIVARRHGEAVARATARHMEYSYPENWGRRVPLTNL